MDRNLLALQTEIGRLQKMVQAREQQLERVTAEAQRLALQGQQVEAEKVDALACLIALLLEHHEGCAGISVALVHEIKSGKAVYGRAMRLSADTLSYIMSVVDEKGNEVDKPGHEVRERVKEAAQPEPEEPRESFEALRERLLANG